MERILDGAGQFAFLGLMLASTVVHIRVLNTLIERKAPWRECLKLAMLFVIISMWVLIIRIFCDAFGAPNPWLDIAVVATFAFGLLLHTWVFLATYYLHRVPIHWMYWKYRRKLSKAIRRLS